MKALLLAVALLAAAPVRSQEPRRAALDLLYTVEVRANDGDARATVLAGRVPLWRLLGELTDQLGWTLEGLTEEQAGVAVSAHLEDRPVADVFEFLLGSVGLQAELRNDTVFVRRVDAREAAPAAVQQVAAGAYLRALRAFPDHPTVPRALYGQAVTEVLRGNDENARALFLQLVERFPSAAEVPQALLRTSRLLVDAGRWREAEEILGRLLHGETTEDEDREARLTIARCTLEQGDAQRTLFALDAVERIHPARTRSEVQERLYLRARALNGVQRHDEALELLDEADAYGLDPESQRWSLSARGAALEALAAPADAARAYLALAQVASGPEQAQALEAAARLSLEADDVLGALFVAQHASALGSSARVEPFARRARVQLGLDQRPESGTTWQQRLARAERLHDGGLDAEALELLDDLAPLRDQMPADQAVRFTLVWARVIASEESLDAALAMLREALPGIEDPEHRRSVYLLAARLLEGRERFEEAVEAYRGRL